MLSDRGEELLHHGCPRAEEETLNSVVYTVGCTFLSSTWPESEFL